MASRSQYSRAAIWLHWLMALLLVGNFAGGLLLEGFVESADAAKRATGERLLLLHMSSGLLILVLTFVRLALRLGQGVPTLPDHMTATERWLARAIHVGFYALMLLVPLAGWLMVSAGGEMATIRWFGLLDWPLLPVGPSKAVAGAAYEAHELLAFAGAGLLALHVAGALKHHFLDRDEVLARMLPFLRRA